MEGERLSQKETLGGNWGKIPLEPPKNCLLLHPYWPPIGCRNFAVPFDPKKKILSVPYECRRHDHSIFEKLHLIISILFQVEIDIPALPRSRCKVRLPVHGFTRSDFAVYWLLLRYVLVNGYCARRDIYPECCPVNFSALGYSLESLCGKSGPASTHRNSSICWLSNLMQHSDYGEITRGVTRGGQNSPGAESLRGCQIIAGVPKSPKNVASRLLSSIQCICFRKTSGASTGAPNLLLAPGAI